MTRLLITGGSGDLARHVCRSLEYKYDIKLPTKKELDVSDKDSVNRYFTCNEFDVVVNLAGTLYSSEVQESEPELWTRDIEVNLIGTYLVSRAAILQNKNVRIINVASTAAFNSYKDWTSYCASKAGVVTLSKGMVKSGFNIIVLCPGAINTKIRNGLNIVNDKVMSIEEGGLRIIEAIEGKYPSSSIVKYRKNEIDIFSVND